MFPNFASVKLVMSDGTAYPYVAKGDHKSKTGRFQEGSILDMEARECLADIYRLRRHISGEEPFREDEEAVMTLGRFQGIKELLPTQGWAWGIWSGSPYARSAEDTLRDRCERLARLLNDPGWATACEG
jgi:hypothetical protein